MVLPLPKDGNPGELSAAASTMASRIQMLRAVYGGTETMRAMEEEFLPKYDKESQTRYDTRLASTFALNKLREAVDAASAKPFRTLLKLNNNTDADVDLWVPDIDLQGNHLHLFTHTLFNNAMLDGLCHVLVDHPSTLKFNNLAEQKEAGVRPFFKMVRNTDIAAAYDEYDGGDVKTLHLRVKSFRVERDGFKEVIYDQIRVMEIEPGTEKGVVQLWEQKRGQGGGAFKFVEELPIEGMMELPFATLYAGEKESDYLARPVFIDLAYKQIEHWISSSDQRSILAAARFPMLACSGVQIDEEDDEASFAIGPYKVLYSPEANGRWYYVEPKGTAIESGRKDLEMLEMQMDMMALNPVTGTHRQYVPQNERDIQETRVHSVVHDMAISCQNTIQKAIRFAGDWTGKDLSAVTVLLNTEFSNTKDRLAEIAHLIKVWEKRGLTRETLLNEMRNRNLLGTDVDPKLEAQLLDQLGPEPAGGEPKPPEVDPEAGDFPKGQNRPKRQV